MRRPAGPRSIASPPNTNVTPSASRSRPASSETRGLPAANDASLSHLPSTSVRYAITCEEYTRRARRLLLRGRDDRHVELARQHDEDRAAVARALVAVRGRRAATRLEPRGPRAVGLRVGFLANDPV